MTNFMMIWGIYVNERHLQKERRVIAVNVPISLGIEPVKSLPSYEQYYSNHIYSNNHKSMQCEAIRYLSHDAFGQIRH